MPDSITDLYLQIREKEERGEYTSQEDLDRDYSNLGREALRKGNYDAALNLFMKVGDRERVEEIGKICLEKCWFIDAVIAFESLQDHEALLTVAHAAEKHGYYTDMDMAISTFIWETRSDNIREGFKGWASGKGFNDGCVTWKIHKSINLAYHLSPEYDYGVGIAKGGLFLAYIFGLFGLDTKIVEYHRNKGRGLKWIDSVSKDELENKRIVVFDKDVRSGETSGRVAEELVQYNPRNLDLVLMLEPGDLIGTLTESIPEEYGKVFYPSGFSYHDFPQALSRLE